MSNRGGDIEGTSGSDTEVDRGLGPGIQGENAIVEEKQRKLGQTDRERIRRGPYPEYFDLYDHFN